MTNKLAILRRLADLSGRTFTVGEVAKLHDLPGKSRDHRDRPAAASRRLSIAEWPNDPSHNDRGTTDRQVSHDASHCPRRRPTMTESPEAIRVIVRKAFEDAGRCRLGSSA
jgi:hypothetical protein